MLNSGLRSGGNRSRRRFVGVSIVLMIVLGTFLFLSDSANRGDSSDSEKKSSSKEENNNEARLEESKESIVELTDEDFHSTVATGWWLMEFYNPYCGACIAFAPTYQQVAGLLPENVKIGKINSVKYTDIGQLYNIQGTPTIKIFKDGQDIDTFYDARTAEKLLAWVNEHVTKAQIAG